MEKVYGLSILPFLAFYKLWYALQKVVKGHTMLQAHRSRPDKTNHTEKTDITVSNQKDLI
jgi:hypothetical protein